MVCNPFNSSQTSSGKISGRCDKVCPILTATGPKRLNSFLSTDPLLALGSLLGTVSLISKHEVVLFVAGGIFVLEALSVIIQVFSFKVFGKRVFRMAPLHHHFEKKGWEESTIVIRFWIISIILVLIALSSLKLR